MTGTRMSLGIWHGPDFVAHVNGGIAIVPRGATGPIKTKGAGVQYTGGSGGHGLDPDVTDVRFMDPTPPDVPYPYPNGYVSYSKSTGQAVNPYTGKPNISKSDPWWHMPWPGRR